MAYVYSNSHLTISADWSTNSQGGCFRAMDAPQGTMPNGAMWISSVLSNGKRSCLYFPTNDPTATLVLDRTHLASRAWAYQERILSRRNLHFTQHQLFWECREGFAGEDLVPYSFYNLTPSYLLNSGARKSADELLFIWCRVIIPNYSDAKITFPTDRLPAVSALAKHFADVLCSPYLAGLWFEGLWYTLSWYRSGPQSTERLKNYIAPSWSWASINAGVLWRISPPAFSGTKKCVEILDSVVDPVGDAFGQVSHGWVKLTGPLVENISPLTHGPTAFLNMIDPDYLWEHPPEKVHCLLLGERPSSIWFFLLLVISSKDSNVYERYGMGSKLYGTSEQWQEKTITII
jgi:hypothetical protein